VRVAQEATDPSDYLVVIRDGREGRLALDIGQDLAALLVYSEEPGSALEGDLRIPGEQCPHPGGLRRTPDGVADTDYDVQVAAF
jgi:hypothetical protein